MNRYKLLLFRILSRSGVLRHLNLYPKVSLGETAIKLPVMGGVGYINLFSRESWLDKIIAEICPIKEGAFIDVGVNLGQTLLKFIEYGQGQTYIGFEPNPSCNQYVDGLRRINRLSNVRVVPVALGERDFVTELYLKDDFDPCGSVIQGLRRNEFYTIAKHVPVFRGDRLFEELEIKSISVLKIDVEGAEFEVLSGLKAVICETRPFIICEILPVGNEEPDIGMMRRKRNDVVEILSSAGYKIFRLLRDGAAVCLDAIESHGDLSLCEYLFVPEEFMGAVRNRLKVVGTHSQNGLAK